MDYTLDRESQSVRSAWDLKEGLADLTGRLPASRKRGSRAQYAIAPRP